MRGQPGLGHPLRGFGGSACPPRPRASPEGFWGALCPPPGRLEFVGGGWCQSDEAAAHYGGALEQLGLGRRLLRRLFGGCGTPRVAWQIDPFGHARDLAATFAQVGAPRDPPRGVSWDPQTLPCTPNLPWHSRPSQHHQTSPLAFPTPPQVGYDGLSRGFGDPLTPPCPPRWAMMGSSWAVWTTRTSGSGCSTGSWS